MIASVIATTAHSIGCYVYVYLDGPATTTRFYVAHSVVWLIVIFQLSEKYTRPLSYFSHASQMRRSFYVSISQMCPNYA